uniref:CNNM transmembrane domain-containing protein n=1 Tax=Populus alba TaxID=43335 RepID=A0A4V6A9I6_POPAL|nr:hypothetical protein D5086_0000114330 [Populus alba]
MTSTPVLSLVLVFGEILPQAVCNRYGLTVGAAMTPLARVLLLLFFPISYPVSKVRQIPDSESTIRTSFLASELYSVQVDLATDNSRQVTETAYMILSFPRKLRLLIRSSTLSCQSQSANVFLCQEGILGETDEHVNIHNRTKALYLILDRFIKDELEHLWHHPFCFEQIEGMS